MMEKFLLTILESAVQDENIALLKYKLGAVV